MVFGKSVFEQVFEDFDEFFGAPSATRYLAIAPATTRNTALVHGNDLSFKMDVSEQPDAYVIHAELPGVPKDNININLENHILTVEASNQESKEDDKEEAESGVKYHIKERRWGTFKRSIRLPKNLDEENVKANFENGVLQVNIGRKQLSEEKKQRKICIE